MRKLPLASALFLAALHFPVAAQDNELGNLTVVWGSDLASGRLITLTDEKHGVITKFDWLKKKGPFFASLVLASHQYTIHLPGDEEAVRLPVANNTTTFLQIARYQTEKGDIGI